MLPRRRSGPADHAALRFLAVLTGGQLEGVNDVLQSALDLPDSRQVLQQIEQCLSPVEFGRWLSALTDALLTIGDASAIGSLGARAGMPWPCLPPVSKCAQQPHAGQV